MWVNKNVWKALEQRSETTVEVNAKYQLLERENAALQTTLDWFRVRVTQLEKERAQMFEHYVGVKLETPVYAKTDHSPAELLHATQSFEDVGDELAAKLGIGWNPDGSLAYSK